MMVQLDESAVAVLLLDVGQMFGQDMTVHVNRKMLLHGASARRKCSQIWKRTVDIVVHSSNGDWKNDGVMTIA